MQYIKNKKFGDSRQQLQMLLTLTIVKKGGTWCFTVFSITTLKLIGQCAKMFQLATHVCIYIVHIIPGDILGL